MSGESLDRMLHADRENLAGFRRMYGPAINLADDVSGLYTLLTQLIGQSRPKLTEDMVLLAALAQDAGFSLIKALILTLEGHLSAGAALTRRAIEDCGVCSRIHHDPSLANLWLSAHDSDKKIRNSFRKSDMFPPADTDPLTKQLARDYTLASRLTHSSILSCARRLIMEEIPTGMSVNYRSNELAPDDRSQPIGMYLWTLAVHLRILRRLASIFGLEGQKWAREYDYVGNKLVRFHFKHRSDINSIYNLFTRHRASHRNHRP